MKYGLEIISKTGEDTSVVAVDAQGEHGEDGLALVYSFDGAEYALCISQEAMTQERRGEVNIFTEFRAGKTTVCRISDGTGYGTFNVRCEKLEVSFNGGDCVAVCAFSGGDGAEQTTITVTARALG
ncbi:MAG: hypothetical protein HFJ81_01400 [Clostridia bacterium]|nr:hypothetical protein [Clostridia bacterium]